ncbi:MAG: tetratricopeptide repeat protein [Pseudomonadota bacterium]
MARLSSLSRYAVAAIFAATTVCSPVFADDDELEALFEGLLTAEDAAVAQIERRIYEIWSQSGSDAMDLLLARGREALEAGDPRRAVEHFSALIDHAPEFAEGYNARATAFFQQQRYGQSLADIQRTLALNPEHFGAMVGLAFILEEIGRPEDALDAWREVEKLNPNRDGLAEAVARLELRVEGTDI